VIRKADFGQIPRKEASVVPTYLTLWKWTEEGAKNAIGTLDRAQTFRTEVEKVGGRVVDFRWLQGQWDGYFIIEGLDDLTVTAGMLKLLGAGNVTTHTMRAFDEGEMKEILQKI
jgi:uncharacterized protein with GYD domain